VWAVPHRCVLYPDICLTTEEKARKNLRVAARTAQADTIQHKENEQYNTQKKNSYTEQYNVTEHCRKLNTQQRKLSVSGK
jgi:hypothetical protein